MSRIKDIWLAATGELRDELNAALNRAEYLDDLVEVLQDQIIESDRERRHAENLAAKAVVERNAARAQLARAKKVKP